MVGRGRRLGEGAGCRPVDWEENYLAALARTGVIREAAGVAGIHTSMVHNRRQRSPAFRARHDAVMKARAARAAGTQMVVAPPPHEAGVALVPAPAPYSIAGGAIARGDFVVRAEADGTLRAIGSARQSWTTKKRAKFLAELASHGNVTRAARFVGMSVESVYKQRYKLPLFAQGWDMAIATGTAALKAHLVEAARASFDPDTVPGPDAEKIRKVSVAEAIHIVKLKGGEGSLVAGPLPGATDGANGRSDNRGSSEEVQELRAKILAKLDRVNQRMRKRHLGEGWTQQDGYMVPPGWPESAKKGPPYPYVVRVSEAAAAGAREWNRGHALSVRARRD